MKIYRIHYTKGPAENAVFAYTVHAADPLDAWRQAEAYLHLRYPHWRAVKVDVLKLEGARGGAS